MKRYLSIFVSSILAGLSIVIGATAFLLLRESNFLAGALIFGLGLFSIMHCRLYLYTGKVGAVLNNKPKYFLDLLICIIGNFIGVIAFASLLKLTRISGALEAQALELVNMKQNDSWYSIFVLSIMCGIMIYIAVLGHEKSQYTLGRVIFCFLAVSAFIISGHEHCIANAAYYTFAGVFNLKAFLYFLLMIVGNAIGSIGVDALLKLVVYLNKKVEEDKNLNNENNINEENR
jgi:formate/nitrite transporter FocA (FNT family)